MAILQSGQQLNIGDQLASNNQRVNLIMQGDGNLVIYRTHYGVPLWASNTEQSGAAYAIMQADGNFVLYTSDGAYRWDTATDGNPGAYLSFQDDGDLVVYDNANRRLWAANTVQDWLSPTFGYSDGGYNHVETSESWKDLCSQLPCFVALQWPGYATTIVEDVINGEPVVIQLWKGWCEKFLGLQNFPGGVGAEVGVYRRIPGRVRPPSLPFLPAPLADRMLSFLSRLSDEEIWWPAPDLNASLEFTLINSITGEAVFSAGPERSYWLAKWMNDDSYTRYMLRQGLGRAYIHPLTVNYWLDYSVNGVSYPRWAGGDALPRGDAQPRASKPAVCTPNPAADVPDLFVRGSDGAIWTKRFVGSEWSPWESLGGAFISDPAATMLGGAAWIFGRSTDNAIYFMWRESSGASSGWQSLDAVGRSVPAVCAPDPSADVPEVFVRGDDGAIWTRRFVGSAWLLWESLGGVFTSDPAVTVLGDAAWIFGRGIDDAIYFMWRRNPVGSSGWQRLDAIGGSVPAVCAPDPLGNVPYVFVRGNDGAIWLRRFVGSEWLPWESLGGAFLSDPSAAALGGVAWIFARGTDNAIYLNWWRGPGDSSGWQRLDGAVP